jgi:hypothetical protein
LYAAETPFLKKKKEHIITVLLDSMIKYQSYPALTHYLTYKEEPDGHRAEAVFDPKNRKTWQFAADKPLVMTGSVNSRNR